MLKLKNLKIALQAIRTPYALQAEQMHVKFPHCFNSSLLKQSSCRNLHFLNFVDRLFHKTLSLKVNEFIPYFWVFKFGMEWEISLLYEYGIFFSLYVSYMKPMC